MADKVINNIKLPNGEIYSVGGAGRFGIKGDYSTHYGIEYCQHGLIENPVGTTDIVVKGGMMLCLPGAETKTTIGSDITYSVSSLTDVTIFYAEGNILESSNVHYSVNEPSDNGIENYIAWWNPDVGKWQFKSNDTGNVWREAIATPIADIRIEEGNIVRIDYIGYRLLNDDIYGLKSETANVDLSNLTEEGINFIIKNSAGASIFDTKLVDHILTYEQSKGWALQGTYVYKEAVAGSRYGYPDFYNKCVEEFESGEKSWLKSNVTKVGSLVDNQGVLSGFTTSNYATVDIGTTSTSDLVEFVISFNTGTWSDTSSKACGVLNGNAFPELQIYNQRANLGGNSSTGSYTYSTNEDVTWKVSIQNGTTRIYRLTSNNEFELDYTLTYSTAISGIVNIGYCNNIRYLNSGFVNLSDSYININGERFWNGADTITKNPNGHLFYDIADKDKIDELYNNNGIAWCYGIDTENERIFLPRTKWFIQPTGEITEVNTVNEAGLPNITGGFMAYGYNGTNSSGAFKGGSISSGNQLSLGGGEGDFVSYSFDASNSNTIYGNSDTVQPSSINQLLYICVGNTNVESAVTDVVDVTTTQNDTMPLFAGMYFDFTPNNVSWLKAGQQANSGGIYKFTYTELINILNGETKYGDLKVINIADMEVGVDYSEYWKVNQEDMTFIAPTAISNKALSGGVMGNGMTLGWTDGATTYGTATANPNNASSVARPTLNALNKSLGTVVSGTTDSDIINAGKETVIGITTDPTKSGIVAEQSTSQLYFKVANAVQNLELLDAGEVLEAVNNVVPNNSSLIAGYGVPDYVRRKSISINTEYVAPYNCFVIAYGGGHCFLCVWLIDEDVRVGSLSTPNTQNVSASAFVPKGEKYKIDAVSYGNLDLVAFEIPLIGEM